VLENEIIEAIGGPGEYTLSTRAKAAASIISRSHRPSAASDGRDRDTDSPEDYFGTKLRAFVEPDVWSGDA